MAQKEGGAEQGRVKTGDGLGAKAAVGAATPGGGVVVEVREKKGPLRAAIPTMPFPLAVICLFLNTFIPGLGKSGNTCRPLFSVCKHPTQTQIKLRRGECKM